MPRQRDVPGEDPRLAPRAASKGQCPHSAHRLDERPPDIAATVASSRLLDPDLLRDASPVLSDTCTPVNARHIHVMCATKDAQRARARAVFVEVWVSYGRESRRGERTAFAMSSLGRPKHEIVIFSSRAPARAREDEDNVSACGPTFDASPQPERLRNALDRPSPHTLIRIQKFPRRLAAPASKRCERA